jgi:serine protease
MKSMNFRTTVVSTLLALLSTSALSNETVRLIVSNNNTTSAMQKGTVSSQSSRCYQAPNGEGAWCIGSAKSSLVTSQSKSSSPSNDRSPSYTKIDVQTYGYEASEIASMMNHDGRFGVVEVDLEVSTNPSSPIPLPPILAQTVTEDPSADYQSSYFNDNSTSNPVGMGVYAAWDEYGALNNSGDKVDVIVLDGSFYENPDVTYFSGRNFSTVAVDVVQENGEVVKESQKRSDNYQPVLDNEYSALCNGHGLGVAATIAGMANNNIAAAGVTNNVNLHVLRTMTCSTGRLSDTADALSWLAGETDGMYGMENVSPYTGGPGVVNLSLAAQTNQGCPNYMQSAIDAANAAGFTIVVAAANYSSDASTYVPANCDGVITVGALTQEGNLASFSNFGETLSYSAVGEKVVAPCSEDGETCWWDGTSFSSPLVAGVIAAAKQVTGASNVELETALRLSSKRFSSVSTCATGVCGDGIPSLHDLITVTDGLMNGRLNTVSHALSNADTCEQSWFVDNFGASLGLCELYKIQFMGGYTDPDTTYELIRTPQGEALTSNAATIVGVFDKGEMFISDINAEEFDYGFRMCTNDVCDEAILPILDTEASAESKPANCP